MNAQFPENPFTPSFGEIPAHLAGRRDVIRSLSRAFDSNNRRPDLTSVFVGARGAGKTALLSYACADAESRGWVAVSVTAIAGMLEDIELQARKKAAHLLDDGRKIEISKVGVAGVFDLELTQQAALQGNWRLRMNDILDQLDKTQTGLLMTVDEVDSNLDEMIQLAAIYQHFVREGRKVALLMAGLPNNVSALLNDKTVSFLRRAQSVELSRISDYEVAEALRKTINDGGREISEADLDAASKAIDGFPFMLQLVGYRAWDENPDEKLISSSDVRAGIKAAQQEMKARVLEATFFELSDMDVKYLAAMAQDEGDSLTSDIEKRLGRSSSQVAQYRKRLMNAGIIGQRGRGVVGFDLPFFKEFLLEKLAE